MQLDQAINTSEYQISEFGEHSVVVNQQTLNVSFVITPNRLLSDWRPRAVDELNASDFEPIIALSPDILILGTGLTQHFLPPAFFAKLISNGIGYEIMNSGAACRTYSILSSEDRNVAAAIIIEKECK